MIQCNIYTKFIERLRNTLRNWIFQCNCIYISHFYEELPNIIATKLQIIVIYLNLNSMQYIHQFTRRLTNTLRIWTFHCSCPYISHFHLDLPNNIATKLQMNSDQSEIWFSAILQQIYWVFDKYTSNLNISMQMSL